MPDLAENIGGKVVLRPHPGQYRAITSRKRFIAIIAGTQSGKTSFGPHWLYQEIQRCGPGDYMVVTPTFALLDKKALPEFLRLFKSWLNLGRYHTQKRAFIFSEEGSRRTFGTYDPDHPTIIWFGYAEDPESLESATIKAAWLDECGQKKFKLGSWEAILRRLSLSRGRVLLTTTPYDLGWLKQHIYDPYKAAEAAGADALAACDIDVIRFDSTENPLFSPEEFEDARRRLPRWKFDLFYRGIFTRPAGLIYSSFIDAPAPAGRLLARFPIPRSWPRYLGLDFGGVNTAGVFLAQMPVQKSNRRQFIAYRTYHAGERSAKEHVTELLKGEPGIRMAVGGSHSEGQWRREFARAGLIVKEPPIKDVEVGIDRLFAAFVDDQYYVFSDLTPLREELATYSREVDDAGNVLEKIEDQHRYHHLDGFRYINAAIRGGVLGSSGGATGGQRPTVDNSLSGLRH